MDSGKNCEAHPVRESSPPTFSNFCGRLALISFEIFGEKPPANVILSDFQDFHSTHFRPFGDLFSTQFPRFPSFPGSDPDLASFPRFPDFPVSQFPGFPDFPFSQFRGFPSFCARARAPRAVFPSVHAGDPAGGPPPGAPIDHFLSAVVHFCPGEVWRDKSRVSPRKKKKTRKVRPSLG